MVIKYIHAGFPMLKKRVNYEYSKNKEYKKIR